ncbi:SDR family NAD(P)-dependent oxidoreductase [Shumkonia mesophila]|uniref:SDR family NAD(P)-dependent oxidoreductase n=1 Tax=Shumkonia mesophila TaxID=2838854 RepID=UPI00293429D3|nr:SDR family oxidoreductase [Shumkonia mesophila]
MSGFATYPSLRDRVVFVTGGATGIGASVVEHFAAQGARVAFADVAAEAGQGLAARIAGTGAPPPLAMVCDLRNVGGLQEAIARAGRELGPVQVLVNNAGNDDRHAVADVTPAYWDERMNVNLRHQFFAAQAVHSQMKAAGGGAIVNMGSIVWKLGMGGLPVYSAAKAAVCGLTRALARDFGGDGIRVNTVLPGWIMTERQIALWLDEAGERALMADQCLKEKIYPADVARLVLFLAADDSRMCTSQDFIIDGGRV